MTLQHISKYLLKSDLTNHHELRVADDIDCSFPILTDQSSAQSCDINVIMELYTKTGLLPENSSQHSRFIDNTLIPGLERAHDIVQAASLMFYNLPAQIRKLMDNDPSQLENFILNKDNETLLIKHGLIKKTEPTTATQQQVQVP